VFEYRVLRRIFGPKRDKVTRDWRKLHNEELNDQYSSPNIFWMIKSRRKGWVGHVAFMGKVEVDTGFWSGNLRQRDHLEDSGMDGRIILRWIFRKWEVMGSMYLRIGTGGGHS
jgi:hypothetical protein